MFENFRQALQDVLRRGTPPEERRALLSSMKQTLALARVGADDLRAAVEKTRARLAAEQRELDTVARRRKLAEGIGDAETVRVAERFERQHAERVEVLVRKLEAQESELALTESEIGEMTEALKLAAKGAHPGAGAGIGTSPAGRTLEEQALEDLDRELDANSDATAYNAMRRSQDREAREAEAARRLEELKRRMGK